jgi:hypothetical protein
MNTPEMSQAIFDLEQQLLEFSRITDDLKTTTEWFVDSEEWQGMDSRVCDALHNKYNGISELYEVRFHQLWNTFEAVTREYHQYRRASASDGTEQDLCDMHECLGTSG